MVIDLSNLDPRHAHDLLTGAIIPRPIAWVSTISLEGKLNLAPFSFFTGVSWAPPIIAFSPVNRTDGSKKDTVLNIEAVPEFVIHIVSVDLLKAMEHTAEAIPNGEDLNSLNDLDLVPSETIRPLRISQAKVAFECTLEQIVHVSEGPDAGNLILGRVHRMHLDDGVVKNGRQVVWKQLDALGRLSGNGYCTTRGLIESEIN